MPGTATPALRAETSRWNSPHVRRASSLAISDDLVRIEQVSVLTSSVHLVCRPRERVDGFSQNSVGDWRDVLEELPLRIHSWMPRLASEGVVGADAIFACLGPSLKIFSRYERVEKSSGEKVELTDYLEHVWAAVAREGLSMIFSGADATGMEEDARLTAMWLWTVAGGSTIPSLAYDAPVAHDESTPANDG
jgi:adenine-specific DNA methylase